MSWNFETDPDFQKKLDWMERFVQEEVEPLTYVLDCHPYDVTNEARNKLVKPLQAEVRRQGLWACHLGPELGGQGYGQVKLTLMNEILGRAGYASIVFGCQAPDTGNAEIIAHYGTQAQKDKYLMPLLEGDIVSSFSMTEPQGGSDPKVFTTSAVLDGDEWVINGEKWFSSHAHLASFLITMAVTDPDAASPHKRMSTFIVPAHLPGVEILRNMPHGASKHPGHAYMRYNNVRIPKDHILGPRGEGFAVVQTRLGGGRIHHAMRTIAQCKKALDMMCERALSRYTQGSQLSEKGMVQAWIADSWAEIEQFRLLVLQTAWKIDHYKDYLKVRKDISAVKLMAPRVFHAVASRALQVHGSLGLTPDMPIMSQVLESYHMGLADGPTEVHQITVAKQLLRNYRGTNRKFPTEYIPYKTEEAEKKFAGRIGVRAMEHAG